MIIVPFEPWHFHSFMARKMPQPMTALRELIGLVQPASTLSWMEGERVMAFGGIAEMWEGCGEAWVQIDPLACRQPKKLIKGCREVIDSARQRFWRIQATVRSDFREGVRFAQSLGFSFDTPDGYPMKKYGPDAGDYYMMSITDED